MKHDRRQFISAALAGGVAASLSHPTAGAQSSPSASRGAHPRYALLDQALATPVLRRELFKSPVIIGSIELLEHEGNYLCRVRSRDGAEGISVGHAAMRYLYPIFLQQVEPFFIGKDARDLDLLMEKVYIYDLNFRLSGLAIGVPLATLEFALLDMLGRIANQSMGQLIGSIHHPDVALYQATEYREKPVAESLDLIKRDVAEYSARAVKIKVGGLMFMTADHTAVAPAGRTEAIIPLVRATFGPEMALYADANGFYSVQDAIRVGRLLEEHRYGFFEEPVHFDWYEETRQVAEALKMPVAGGEQEYSLHGFRWLLANDGIQIVQPDTYYFGGMIRSMKVARMASAVGRECTPHMSGGGLGFLYMMHFVSALPNAAAHHEFKGFRTRVPYHCPTSPMKVIDGKVKVPTGPGLGVEIEPDYLRRHQAVKR